MRFTTSTNMAGIDEETVANYGITESALMENAGQLTARHIRRQFLSSDETRVLVVCGKGHNGADGMVTARWLHQWGKTVSILALFEDDELEGLPKKQYEYIRSIDDLDVFNYSGESDLPSADVYVDALFGTGLNGDPRTPYDRLIRSLNERHVPLVSVDVPSGLSGDDNRPYDPCIQADMTVTFGLPKLGMLLEPGYSFVGELITQGIGFPAEVCAEQGGDYHLIAPGDVRRYVPVRYPMIHKGAAGYLGILGGSDQYPGAPFLAAQAASRIGSGLTSLVGPDGFNKQQSHGERDLVFSCNLDELLEDPTRTDHQEFLDQQGALVIGPGLGQSDEKRDGLKKLIPELESPTVVDADGLNNLQDDLDAFEQADTLVLTPHPGEAARLLDSDAKSIVENPIDTVQQLVDRIDQTVVLKTSRPVVGHPDGSVSVNVTGSPALAKAGSGDVLSGMIGGLLAQNIEPGPATCLALYLHGTAGRYASETHDTISVKSEDVIHEISTAIEELEVDGLPDWYPIKFESIPDSLYRWNPFPN